jgi:hypothetical protein
MTAIETLDLQRAVKEPVGFESGRGKRGRYRSLMRSVTSPSSTA